MTNRLIPRRMLEKVARHFRLLGEPARLEILNCLNVHGEMSVQELVTATGHQQANISKHLKLLADEDLVSRRPEGQFVFYRISDPTLATICMIVCGRIQNDVQKQTSGG